MKNIPDVTSKKTHLKGNIKWVGMKKIESLILIKGNLIPAKINFGVNLIKDNAKGIHMSRLFLLCGELEKNNFSSNLLKSILKQGLDSHESLSDEIKMEVSFEYLIKRKSLVSGYIGNRLYPVVVEMVYNKSNGYTIKLKSNVFYSSACPCSEALARKAMWDKLEDDFRAKENLGKQDLKDWILNKKGVYAVPHSQRSVAKVEVLVDGSFEIEDIDDLINLIENTLKTEVQGVVKREDEQAFAVLNGENLMFCEDAVRKLSIVLDNEAYYKDFFVEMIHEESLHPHNAVAINQKGFL